ncbi:long-chain-fatty-acid--CoA ligase [Neorhodopirellula pilleata]|uniref:Long-chain-fatty-acid--CoA ligase n=1 Tax=Neorhodopirellula pilleata TaxID=2714738 RepID=A0A5C5ZPU3_9BACT|nr:long-chain fatty acid--CoA ligase [Neorhodopirellula pilleata]TWT89206.1 Long-chain-fatty-acid--CoA ligase [Neorhodopirellula pilleata]
MGHRRPDHSGLFDSRFERHINYRPPCGLDSFEGIPAYGVLQHAAEQLPGRDAIVYGETHWSYRDLNQAAIRCAAVLQRLGIRAGDRVGIQLPNIPEFVIAANAIWRAGGVAIAISPLMVADEVDKLLKQTDCRLVVCLDMLSDTVTDPDVRLLLVSIREHLPSLHQIGYLWMRRKRTGVWTLPADDRSRWFWDEMSMSEAEYHRVEIDPLRDPAYILPTGGTTGVPKAVTLSHTNMVANAWQQYVWTRRSFGREKMLAVLPFFHSYGMSATVMGGAATGSTLIMHHRFNTKQVIGLLHDHQPTVFHAVPAMLVAMNERFRLYPPNLRGLRWVISGGATLDAQVAEEFSRHTGALVVEGYGLSEASPVTHVGHLFRSPAYGTIGYPLPRTQSRIVDSENHDRCVEPGEVGELLVRGPQVMLGYWNDPATTATAIRDGWLHTGDLACQDEAGRYQIVGRKKDLIITSGFNVYPSEVETAICEHPSIRDAAVVGVPDPARGEIVKAFVVLEPSAGWNESDVRAHCDRVLAKYKRPRLFEVCEDLPRNFLGKVIRRELRSHEPMNQASASNPDSMETV